MNREIISGKSIAGVKAGENRKELGRKEVMRSASSTFVASEVSKAMAMIPEGGCITAGNLPVSLDLLNAKARSKPAKIRYRKRGVERTKLQVYVSNEVFDQIYALARRLRVSMGAAVERLAKEKGEKGFDSRDDNDRS